MSEDIVNMLGYPVLQLCLSLARRIGLGTGRHSRNTRARFGRVELPLFKSSTICGWIKSPMKYHVYSYMFESLELDKPILAVAQPRDLDYIRGMSMYPMDCKPNASLSPLGEHHLD